MRKYKRGRILSMLLVLSMVLSMLPLQVFAAGYQGLGEVNDGVTPLLQLAVKMENGKDPVVKVIPGKTHGGQARMGFLIIPAIEFYPTATVQTVQNAAITAARATANICNLENNTYWPATGGAVNAWNAKSIYTFPMMGGYAEVNPGKDGNTEETIIPLTEWNENYAATWKVQGNGVSRGDYSTKYQKQKDGTQTNQWKFNSTEFPGERLPYVIFVWSMNTGFNAQNKHKVAAYEFTTDFYGNAEFVVPTPAGANLTISGGASFTASVGDQTATPASQTLTVKNEGSSASEALTVSISGTDANVFQVTPASLTALDPNGSHNLTVTANPTGLSKGTYTATLTVTDGKVTATKELTLTVSPAALTSVTISGTAEVGQTLTSVYEPPAVAQGDLTYQWYRTDSATATGGSAISNATGQTYTLQDADIGKHIYLVVTDKNNSKQVTSNVIGPITFRPKVVVRVDGAPVSSNDGFALTVGQGGTALTYVPKTGTQGGYFTIPAGTAGLTANGKIYVNGVKGTTDQNIGDSGMETTGTQTVNVDFYTVKFDTAATLAHAKDKDNQDVGTITNAPEVTAKVSKLFGQDVSNQNIPATSGTTVIVKGSGSKVTHTLASYTEDYALEWSRTGGNTTDATTNQAYTVTYDSAVTKVTPTLTQNTYDVTGTADKSGVVNHVIVQDEKGKQFQITFNKGTSGTQKLPNGTYTVVSGSYEGNNTVEVTYEGSAEKSNFTVNKAANPNAFQLKIVERNWGFQVTDSIGSKETNSGAGTMSAKIEKTYPTPSGATEAQTVTATITNTGTMDITNFTVTQPTELGPIQSVGAITGLEGGTLKVGGTATFTYTIKSNLQVKDSKTGLTFKLSGDGAGTGDVTLNYVLAYQMNPAEIKAAGVKEIDAPVANATPDKLGNIVPSVTDVQAKDTTYSVQSVTWTAQQGSAVAGNFAAGQVYVATVELKANGNHVFAQTGNWTFNGQTPTSATVGGEKNDVLTLTYTFPATAPTLDSVTLTGTSATTVDATVNVTTERPGDTKVYYALYEGTSNTAPTAEQIVSGNIAGATCANTPLSSDNGLHQFTGLKPLAKYTVYAVARVNGDGTLSAVVNATDTTWHKVTVSVEMGPEKKNDGGKVTLTKTDGVTLADTPSTSGTLEINGKDGKPVSVKEGSTLKAEAARTGSNGTTSLGNPNGDGWAFSKWNTTAGTVNPAEANTVFTPTNGTAENALTAYFRRIIEGDPTVTGNAAVGDVLTANVGTVMIGGAKPTFGETPTTGVSFQWQYKDGQEWKDIASATSHQWTVTTGANNLYVGKEIRVKVIYKDDDGEATSVVSASTAPVGKAVALPGQITLEKVESTKPGDSAEINRGGLKLTFTGTVDDTTNKAIQDYKLEISSGGKVVKTYTFPAGQATTGTGDHVVYADGNYTVWLPADPQNIVPTAANQQQYTAKLTATAKKAATGFTDNGTGVSSTAADAGRVRLTKDMLTLNGQAFSSVNSFDYSFENKVFNGARQTITGEVLTKDLTKGQHGTNVQLHYGAANTVLNAAPAPIVDGQTNVNITAGADGKYYITAVVQNSGYYLDLVAPLGTWSITQAKPTMVLPQVSASQNVEEDLAPSVRVEYAAGDGANPGKDITGWFTYAYAKNPENAKFTLTGSKFFSAETGVFHVNVTASYGTERSEQDKANIALPDAGDMTVNVSDNKISTITLKPKYEQGEQGATNAVDLSGVLDRVYAGHDTTVASLDDLMVVVGYENSGTQHFTLSGTNGLAKLPDNFSIALEATDVATWNGTEYDVTFGKAGTVNLVVSVNNGTGVISAKQAVTLRPASLDYQVKGTDKEYDGTAAANGFQAPHKNEGNNSTVQVVTTGNATVTPGVDNLTATTNYQADGANNDVVYIDNSNVTLVFDNKNAGDGKTVRLEGAVSGLSGEDAGFYALGSATEGQANITKATLVVTAITGGIDPVLKDTAHFTGIPGEAQVTVNGNGDKNPDQFNYQEGKGVQKGDTVYLTFNGDYQANEVTTAGTGKTITNVTNVTLVTDKGDGANYILQVEGSVADGGKFGVVTDREVDNILLELAGATHTVTYGTSEGSYQADTADAAKQMPFTGLKITVYWKTGGTDTYTVGTNDLPSEMKFVAQGDPAEVSISKGNSALQFLKKAQSGNFLVEYYGKQSNSVTFTMNPKPLTYTITPQDKVYDGTVDAQGLENGHGQNTIDNNSSIALADGGVLVGDDVRLKDEYKLSFDGKDVGTHNVSVSNLALEGGQSGFYSGPTGKPGTAEITPATLKITDINQTAKDNGDAYVAESNVAEAPHITENALDSTGWRDPKNVAATYNNAGDGKKQFTVEQNHGLYGTDQVTLNFKVTYEVNKPSGWRDVKVTNSGAETDFTLGGQDAGNYTLDVSELRTALNNTNNLRRIGVIKANGIVGFTIVQAPKQSYAQPETGLVLETDNAGNNDLVVRIAYADNTSVEYTYGTEAFNGLNLKYYYKDKNGAKHEITVGEEIVWPDDSNTQNIYVEYTDSIGNKTYNPSYPVTLEKHVIQAPDADEQTHDDFTSLSFYAEKVYDGNTKVSANGLKTAAGGNAITVQTTDVVNALTTGLPLTYVDSDNNGYVDYVLIPIESQVFGGNQERDAWLKANVVYADKNAGAKNKNVTVTLDQTTPIVGKHAGRYTLEGGITKLYTETISGNTIKPKELNVTGLAVAPVKWGAATTTVSGTAVSAEQLNANGTAYQKDIFTVQGLVSGDVVSLSYGATYGSSKTDAVTDNSQLPYLYKHGESGQTITVNTLTLQGASAGNYTCSQTATTVQGLLQINDIPNVLIYPSKTVQETVGKPKRSVTPVKMEVPLGIEAIDAGGDTGYTTFDYKPEHFARGAETYSIATDSIHWWGPEQVEYHGYTGATDGVWYNSRNKVVVANFQTAYTLGMTMKPALGYQFTENTKVQYTDDENGTNGLKHLSGTVQDGQTLLIEHTFPITGAKEPIYSATVYVRTPTEGGDPNGYQNPADYDWENSEHYELESFRWLEGNALPQGGQWPTGTPAATQFLKDQEYTVEFVVYAKEGYAFRENVDFYFLDEKGFLDKHARWDMKPYTPMTTPTGETVATYLVRAVFTAGARPGDSGLKPADGKFENMNFVIPAPRDGAYPYQGAARPWTLGGQSYHTDVVTGSAIEWYKSDATSAEDLKTEAYDPTNAAWQEGTPLADLAVPFEADTFYYAKFTLQIKDQENTTYDLKRDETGKILTKFFANAVNENSTPVVMDFETNGAWRSAVSTGVSTLYITVKEEGHSDQAKGTLTVWIQFDSSGKFTPMDSAASQITILVDQPVVGGTPDTTTLRQDSALVSTITDGSWNPNENPFKGGTSYVVSTDGSAKSGHIIDVSTDGTMFFVNGMATPLPYDPDPAVSGNKTYVTGTGANWIVSYEFPATGTSTKDIVRVDLSITEPAKGNAPDQKVGNIVSVPAGAVQNNDPAITWSPSHSTFQAGQSYTMSTVLTPSSGDYQFTGNTVVLVNGRVCTVTVNQDGTATVTCTFQIPADGGTPDNTIHRVTAVVGEPAKGRAITAPTPAVPSDYTVVSHQWYRNGSTISTSGTFTTSTSSETTYKLVVTMKPVASKTFAADAKYYINSHDVNPTGNGEERTLTYTWTLPKDPDPGPGPGPGPDPGPGGGGGGGGAPAPTPVVDYHLGAFGTTPDPTTEKVASGKYPSKVPNVTAVEGYEFKGWSTTDPATLKEGEKPALVDPTKVKITKDTVFYAVYEGKVVGPEVPPGKDAEPGDRVDGHLVGGHLPYVKGYPDNTFGPADNITRAEVATIIARACLEEFQEGASYGNGGYKDLDGHWATSAIAYCTMNNVFNGYTDGTFRPDQPITRQEFSLVFARLVGLLPYEDVPFSDIGEAGFWALDGIYTAYTKGWINGYTDGTFRPLNNISRAEAVKIVNRYLNRGVDMWGLTHAQVRDWPDVPESYWAYFEIIEAANGHAYYYPDDKNPPEVWTKLWSPLG